MSSPESSDAEQACEESDDDVFKFHAQRFKKSPSSKERSIIALSRDAHHARRRQQAQALQEKRATIKRKEERQQQQQQQHQVLFLSDSEDEQLQDDTEDLGTALINVTGKLGPFAKAIPFPGLTRHIDGNFAVDVYSGPHHPVALDSTFAASSQEPRGSAETSTLDVFDEISDSEDDHDEKKTVPNHACEALERAKRAQKQLQQAQHYQAEDIVVQSADLELPEIFQPPLHPAVKAPLEPPKPSKNLGPRLSITCRIRSQTNKLTSHTFTMHSQQPFEVLFALVEKEYQSKKVSLSFDGESLRTGATPQDCDMESGDIVDGAVL